MRREKVYMLKVEMRSLPSVFWCSDVTFHFRETGTVALEITKSITLSEKSMTIEIINNVPGQLPEFSNSRKHVTDDTIQVPDDTESEPNPANEDLATIDTILTSNVSQIRAEKNFCKKGEVS
jgi:hypothetical protein